MEITCNSLIPIFLLVYFGLIIISFGVYFFILPKEKRREFLKLLVQYILLLTIVTNLGIFCGGLLYFLFRKNLIALLVAGIALVISFIAYHFWKKNIFPLKKFYSFLEGVGFQREKPNLLVGHIEDIQVMGYIVSPYVIPAEESSSDFERNVINLVSPFRTPFTNKKIRIEKINTWSKIEPKNLEPPELKKIIEEAIIDFDYLRVRLLLEEEVICTQIFGSPFLRREQEKNVINGLEFHRRIRSSLFTKYPECKVESSKYTVKYDFWKRHFYLKERTG